MIIRNVKTYMWWGEMLSKFNSTVVSHIQGKSNKLLVHSWLQTKHIKKTKKGLKRSIRSIRSKSKRSRVKETSHSNLLLQIDTSFPAPNLNPLSIALPILLNNFNVYLPAASVFPPALNNVLEAKYCYNMEISRVCKLEYSIPSNLDIFSAEGSLNMYCTSHD